MLRQYCFSLRSVTRRMTPKVEWLNIAVLACTTSTRFKAKAYLTVSTFQ